MSFKFEIGELVYTKAGIADAMLTTRGGGYSCQPTHYTVIQRMADECPGGTQRSYILTNGLQKFEINEIAVAKVEEFDVATWADRTLENIIAEGKRRKLNQDA